MEIRCCEGCVDFDSPEKPSVQLKNDWDEAAFTRETAAVYQRMSRGGRCTLDDLRRFLTVTKFTEERGRDKTLPHEREAEVVATFGELDLNCDGNITLREFRDYHRSRFERVLHELREQGQ